MINGYLVKAERLIVQAQSEVRGYALLNDPREEGRPLDFTPWRWSIRVRIEKLRDFRRGEWETVDANS